MTHGRNAEGSESGVDHPPLPDEERSGPSASPFVCPRCGAVSHHPTDKEQGYCARCHDWTRQAPDWKRLALHALHDLRLMGVPIESIVGVDETVLTEVDRYDREMTTFS